MTGADRQPAAAGSDRSRSGSAQASSAEQPWPVRVVATKISEWINRLGSIWVEGEITQINARPGTRMAFVVLRDPSANMSLQVTCSPTLLRDAPVPLAEGSRVVVYGKPTFYTGRGTLSLRVTEIRAVGIGELLARIERLRKLLAAEGMFDPRLKRPLPFLPGTIGLITGRASAAERDVLSVAQQRWADVRFTVRNTAVQGTSAVPQVVDALRELDADPAVEVIIIARGGGSVEDLLPFSDEALCRAVAAATTPVVSAIGHEPDSPLLDLVADLRAATPTDAAKRVVPDVAAERALLAELRARSAGALRGWVDREVRGLEQIRSRPVLADPLGAIARLDDEVLRLRDAVRRDVRRAVESERQSVDHLRARLTTLGPSATLERGYAVVQHIGLDGTAEVLRTVDDAPPGAQLRVRVADGAVRAAVISRDT